ncbi:hypothetical protein Pcinc_002455 [Petrolisthes cinctipes]|uniref:Uncharacterized protein n=1 Tax=Petrolisthes cinctipes TaxID=88211 RepID=A0AAE1L3G2_PETCI|nr:hypothetical protein Pcinc_002455 [Petrolisthes cinctipes]
MQLKLMVTLGVVLLTVAVTEAKPRYLAVPVEDLRLVRRVRSLPSSPDDTTTTNYHHMPFVPTYVQRARRQVSPVYVQNLPNVVEFENPEVVAASDRYERQAHGHSGYGDDHVDYGAYTGGYGAFGWYSDHPVCINCGYGYH